MVLNTWKIHLHFNAIVLITLISGAGKKYCLGEEFYMYFNFAEFYMNAINFTGSAESRICGTRPVATNVDVIISLAD
jgi:hypothetical protein